MKVGVRVRARVRARVRVMVRFRPMTTGDHIGAAISLPEAPLGGCMPLPETQLIQCLLVAP